MTPAAARAARDASTAGGELIAQTLARLQAALDPPPRQFGVPSRSDEDLHGGIAHRPELQLTPAAVLAPLVERDGALHVIFTERAAHLRKHAGQISFPGGRMDAEDRDPMETALREAEEEIGLARAQVDVLGAFDPYRTVTGFVVTPFVGVVRGGFTPQPDPSEVAGVFDAPLDVFLEDSRFLRREVMWKGAQRRYYEVNVEGKRIWGATAGMLKALHDRVHAAQEG